MNNDLKKIEKIFRDIIDEDNITISENSNSENTSGWDSFAHINIVMAIESEFKIKFGLGELEELKNVGEMIKLINQKKNNEQFSP